jgi:hypothetical protein
MRQHMCLHLTLPSQTCSCCIGRAHAQLWTTHPPPAPPTHLFEHRLHGGPKQVQVQAPRLQEQGLTMDSPRVQPHIQVSN